MFLRYLYYSITLNIDTCFGPCEAIIRESNESNTVELHLAGLTGTTGHSNMQKIRLIGFFFEIMLHWQFEVRLLLFRVHKYTSI